MKQIRRKPFVDFTPKGVEFMVTLIRKLHGPRYGSGVGMFGVDVLLMKRKNIVPKNVIVTVK